VQSGWRTARNLGYTCFMSMEVPDSGNKEEKPKDHLIKLPGLSDLLISQLDLKKEEDQIELQKIREVLNNDSSEKQIVEKNLEDFSAGQAKLIDSEDKYLEIVANLDRYGERELIRSFDECLRSLSTAEELVRATDTDRFLADKMHNLYSSIRTLRSVCIKREVRLARTAGAKLASKIALFRSPDEVIDRSEIRQIRESVDNQINTLKPMFEKNIENRRVTISKLSTSTTAEVKEGSS
jgi:hypothetical protein